MIAYLEGTLFKREEERILLLVNQVGYEVLLPAMTAASLKEKALGSDLAFYIYYHQTERQPRPTLIGFQTDQEKDFFQLFISVEDIGPMKAVKAMTLSVGEMASLIENEDIRTLSTLKGVGKRTAQKIVATLAGKTGRFMEGAEILTSSTAPPSPEKDFIRMVKELLTRQLGYGVSEADRLIGKALAGNPDISTPEALLEEVYKTWAPDGERK